jgi:hypothetical protein
MLNAFCRAAPSVLFSFLAILDAGVFLLAIFFSSRTSPEVHARRFFVLFAIFPPCEYSLNPKSERPCRLFAAFRYLILSAICCNCYASLFSW